LEAIDDFRRALRSKADYPEAHFNPGNEYYKLQDLAATVAEYQAALQARQEFPQAHGNLGVILAKDPAHLQEGLAELRMAAKTAPLFGGGPVPHARKVGRGVEAKARPGSSTPNAESGELRPGSKAGRPAETSELIQLSRSKEEL
jgi:tetratricopeptide (TPR) repeat protein